MPRLRWIFLVAVLLGTATVLTLAALDRRPGVVGGPVETRQLVPGIWVTAQVVPDQLVALRHRGFVALIDLRPDGEVVNQPSSKDMAGAASRAGMAFHYTPVPHGEIPARAVADLAQALATDARPVLLYCHSGRRAARTWALAEASRAGGLGAAAIEAAVREAGQPIDDLTSQIVSRIAARHGAVTDERD
jgi:uncharacterized protein (TIGR01244 family)